MVDKFLDWFEHHKMGVVGTLMLHTFLMFGFAMGKLGGLPEPGPQNLDLALELATPMDPVDPELVGAPTMEATEVRNLVGGTMGREAQAYDHMGARAQERMANNVEKDLLDFERAEFERLAAERTARGEDIEVPELDTSRFNKRNYMNTQKPEPVMAVGNTTVRYDLPPRVHEELEVPAYLCKGRGRVVIRIAVDRSGRVTKAEVDAAASTGDACMVENATSSANRARFDASRDAPQPQRGTITYTFMAQ